MVSFTWRGSPRKRSTRRARRRLTSNARARCSRAPRGRARSGRRVCRARACRCRRAGCGGARTSRVAIGTSRAPWRGPFAGLWMMAASRISRNYRTVVQGAPSAPSATFTHRRAVQARGRRQASEIQPGRWVTDARAFATSRSGRDQTPCAARAGYDEPQALEHLDVGRPRFSDELGLKFSLPWVWIARPARARLADLAHELVGARDRKAREHDANAVVFATVPLTERTRASSSAGRALEELRGLRVGWSMSIADIGADAARRTASKIASVWRTCPCRVQVVPDASSS